MHMKKQVSDYQIWLKVSTELHNSIWLNKIWKLYYQISVLIYTKQYQFHVILFIHPFQN